MPGASELKLNLGSGLNPRAGYVNVDKSGGPDLVWDLEKFPWPWDTGSVDEVLLIHVLEHLGRTDEIYCGIMKELYRVCRGDALIVIVVPHPRHDHFIDDPTHVRAVTAGGLELFSKAKNREWQEKGFSNSPLAFYHDVDFEIVSLEIQLDEAWRGKFAAGQVTQNQILEASRNFNNVIENILFKLRVVKPQS